jgi:hypothetical protein
MPTVPGSGRALSGRRPLSACETGIPAWRHVRAWVVWVIGKGRALSPEPSAYCPEGARTTATDCSMWGPRDADPGHGIQDVNASEPRTMGATVIVVGGLGPVPLPRPLWRRNDGAWRAAPRGHWTRGYGGEDDTRWCDPRQPYLNRVGHRTRGYGKRIPRWVARSHAALFQLRWAHDSRLRRCHAVSRKDLRSPAFYRSNRSTR